MSIKPIRPASDAFPTLPEGIVTRARYIEEDCADRWPRMINRYFLEISDERIVGGLPSELTQALVRSRYVNYCGLAWGVGALSAQRNLLECFSSARRQPDMLIRSTDYEFELHALPAGYDAWDAPFRATTGHRFRSEYRDAVELTTRKVLPLEWARDDAPSLQTGYVLKSTYTETVESCHSFEVALDLDVCVVPEQFHSFRAMYDHGGINYRGLYWRLPDLNLRDLDMAGGIYRASLNLVGLATHDEWSALDAPFDQPKPPKYLGRYD